MHNTASTMNATRRRRELRDFLIARRAAVSPTSAGLPAGTRRRTPGLRREELATLASVGVTWYTWLEQGRDIRVSADTLDRIAVALRLTPTDTAYLFSLAGVPRAETIVDGQRIALDSGVQSVLDAFQAPAFVVGSSWDVEAFNAMADRIYGFTDTSGPFAIGPFARNHMWRFFMDPDRRAVYLDWSELAQIAVGILRTAYARRVGDPYFDSLIRALTEGSREFKKLWNAQQTAPLTPDRVRLSVPKIGELTVMSMRLRFSGGNDSLLMLLPPADEPSARKMLLLARPDQAASSAKPAKPARPASAQRQRKSGVPKAVSTRSR
jgi:transcriptional regulator with XRE-family HTH domain